jgi:hypothetical protein
MPAANCLMFLYQHKLCCLLPVDADAAAAAFAEA